MTMNKTIRTKCRYCDIAGCLGTCLRKDAARAIHRPSKIIDTVEDELLIVPVSTGMRNAQLPDWFKDVYIKWGDHSKPPAVKLLTSTGRALVAECDAEGFELYNGREWRALHLDCTLMTQYVHSGALKKVGPRRYQTSQWQGFGGRVITIKTVDGDIIDLRGPWFGKPPPGWQEVHTIGMDRISNGETQKPWHVFSGQFGMFVSEVALISCLLRSKEKIGLARVAGKIEPYLLKDGAPKRFLVP